MSNPFSGIPDPVTPPFKRRIQPKSVQQALRAIQETLRPALPTAQRALGQARRIGKEALRQAKGQNLLLQAKRHPRTVGAVGGAFAMTLVGVIALSASGAGRSLCPPAKDGKTPFRLLMDPVPPVAAGSQVAIHYDVCGLASGTPYQGRVRLVPQPAAGKKKSARPKPLMVSFKDEVDGVGTRRLRQLNLTSTKPGTYTLELSVADNQGRGRKREQKVLVKAAAD